MNKPAISQQVTFIYTDDLEKMSGFYEDILELCMVLDQGTCRIYSTGANSFLGVCQKDSVSESHQDVIITMVSDDVDGWYDFLVAKQVEIEKPPTQNKNYNIYHFFVRDPEGYLLEFQTFLDPAWPSAV